MALAHSRRPSMACLCVPHADRPAMGDTAKAMSPGVRRESPRVIRSAANTACLSADRL
ncbi:MAG: hypothetical protein U9P07_01855 [Pseudomonadota bacterium]|nr:hypothetical protein [Pseudomonadota bacterium]